MVLKISHPIPSTYSIRQGLSIRENICPDAPWKFWRFAGFTKYFFKSTKRKLRSTAFQRCITLYSQKWTVWPWEAIFCKKLPQKQLFWATRIWIKWLWAAITPVQNLQISKTATFSESSRRQLSGELSGSPLASILSERRAVTLLRGGRHGILQKSAFFASFASPRKFCEEKFY